MSLLTCFMYSRIHWQCWSDTRFGEWQCLIQIHFGGEASDTSVFFPKTRMICISLAYLAEKSMDGCTGDGVDDGCKKV